MSRFVHYDDKSFLQAIVGDYQGTEFLDSFAGNGIGGSILWTGSDSVSRSESGGGLLARSSWSLIRFGACLGYSIAIRVSELSRC